MFRYLQRCGGARPELWRNPFAGSHRNSNVLSTGNRTYLGSRPLTEARVAYLRSDRRRRPGDFLFLRGTAQEVVAAHVLPKILERARRVAPFLKTKFVLQAGLRHLWRPCANLAGTRYRPNISSAVTRRTLPRRSASALHSSVKPDLEKR